MATWFTADTHFSHENIIKYCPDTRGHFNSAEEMNETLIENWNRIVRPIDSIWHLGDFAWGSQVLIKNLLSRLQGRIYIMGGNHDKKAFKTKFQAELIHRGYIENYFDNYLERTFDSTFTVMNHYAQRTWNRAFHGSIHLYGHSHGTLPSFRKSVDVGVDSKDMAKHTGDTLRPWALEEIFTFMNERGNET